MKRNDICDSYLLWLFERVLATRGVITPPDARKHSAQPSRMPARQPLEMPSRYRFHTTRPAPWKPTQVRKGRRGLRRGAAFDLRCRSCQATSSITSPVPLNEIASPV